jgi:hypothetical protein
VLQWLGQSKVKDKHIKKQRNVRVQVVSPPLYPSKKREREFRFMDNTSKVGPSIKWDLPFSLT